MPAAGPVRLTDVASAAGVSVATASRALLGQTRISEATRRRVQAVADELGYVKDARASSLAARDNRVIGLLVRGAQLSYFGELIVSAQRYLVERDHSLIVANGLDSAAEHAHAMHMLRTMRVAGMIIASGQVQTNELEALATSLPVVVAGRPLRSTTVSSVSGDPDAVPRLVDAVLSQGHERVGVVTVTRNASLTRSVRSAAIIRELKARGALVTRIPAHLGVAPTPEDLAGVVGDVTAIMCPNDPSLVATWERLQHLGLSVPDDVSLTGFDGIGQLGSPVFGLTSWYHDVNAFGVEAARIMLGRLADPAGKAVHTTISGHLLPGWTLGPPRE